MPYQSHGLDRFWRMAKVNNKLKAAALRKDLQEAGYSPKNLPKDVLRNLVDIKVSGAAKFSSHLLIPS